MSRDQFEQWLIQHAAYCDEVIEQKRDHLHFRHGKPEDNTKDKIIVPLLDALGYTQPEYRIVETSIAGGWVDYSLKVEEDGPPVVLVEAKPIFDSDLWTRYREQVYQYVQDYRVSVIDREPMKWILLTNGYEIHILRINDRNPHWSFTIGADTASDIFDLLARLNVRDGVIDTRYLEGRRETLDRNFLEDLKRWRLILANGFLLRNPTLTIQDLTLASQTYLNRLMFLRILETYGLRPQAWLARIYRNWKDARWAPDIHPFAQEMLRAFQDTEFRFNTELFKESLVDGLLIDDEFIEAVIVDGKPLSEKVLERVTAAGVELWSKTIYNYDFSELGVDVLGSVYEKFLAHQFGIQNGRVVIRGTDEPTEARKLRRKEGIYYTPEWVTRFTVQACLRSWLDEIFGRAMGALSRNEPQIAYATIQEAATITAVDIAMGSGSFLLQAYEQFYDTYARYNSAVQARREELVSTQARPDLIGIMEYAQVSDPAVLALESIYGVDLDPEAVDLTKLNFWLRVLAKSAYVLRTKEVVHHALPRLDMHFRRGNSLITASRLPGFEDAAAARTSALANAWSLYQEARSNPTEANISAFMTLSVALSSEISSETLPQFFGDGVSARQPLVIELAFPHVFIAPDGTLLENGGFDIVVGNPPYEVLSWRERSISREDEQQEKAYLDAAYATRFQKYNLYRFFIERALDLTKRGGHFGYIVPLTLLGDESSYRVRYKIFAETTVLGFYCFPERARVFEGVTQAVCIVILRKNREYQGDALEDAWRAAIPEDGLIPIAFGLMAESDLLGSQPIFVPLRRVLSLHPRFLPVPSIPEAGWQVLDRLAGFPTLEQWESAGLIEIKQREINLNEDRELYSTTETSHRLIRGEHIAPFELRLDVGIPEFVDRGAFLAKKGGGRFRSGSDHESERVGIQEVSNLALVDRLKATIIPANCFVGHTVDYIVVKDPAVNAAYLVGLLNSDVLDWRFRITSTNNHISTNQLAALPAPRGSESAELASLAEELSQVSTELVALSSGLHVIRSGYARMLNQATSSASTLRAYLSSPNIVHHNHLDDINKHGIVVQLFLSLSGTEALVSAAIAYQEDSRAAPKRVESVIAFSSPDAGLMEFLMLAIDRALAIHGDSKWTKGKSLVRIYDTVCDAVSIPVFSVDPAENITKIHQIVDGLPSIGMSFGEALRLQEQLRQRHHQVSRRIFGIDELPQFESGEERDEDEEEDEDSEG